MNSNCGKAAVTLAEESVQSYTDFLNQRQKFLY